MILLGAINLNRKSHIQEILQSIGSINREFNAKGNYPFKEYSLGRSHMEILFLVSQKECSIKQLSQHLHVTSGGVTQLVDYLESTGLVTKTEDPEDKRIRLVSLTKSSASVVKAFEQMYLRTVGVKFEGLSDQDLGHLQRILNKIRST